MHIAKRENSFVLEKRRCEAAILPLRYSLLQYSYECLSLIPFKVEGALRSCDVVNFNVEDCNDYGG